MSQKPAANLVKNGDFSKGKEGWALSQPSDRIKFEDGFCVMQIRAVVQQQILVGPGKRFRFSVTMKSDSGAASLTEVEISNGERKKWDSVDADWQTYSETITTPDDSKDHSVKISLRANDGREGVFGCYFRDVSLIEH